MEYVCEDPLPFMGLNYYRLKAVDYDGSFEYSDIISIKGDAFAPDMLVYPNPVRNKVFQLSLNFIPESKGIIDIYDFMGNVVFSTTIGDFRGEIVLPESMNRGTYMLNARFNEMRSAARINVE